MKTFWKVLALCAVCVCCTAGVAACEHKHEYTKTVVKPNCIKQGYTTYTCVKCEYSYVDDCVPATGHNYIDGVCSECGQEDPEYVAPQPTSDEYFTFTLLDDNTYEITAKDKNNLPSKIILPSIYNGKVITSIGECAFYNCSRLKSITIPDSVISIGDRAFRNCVGLQYNEYDNGLYLGNSNNPYMVLIKAKSRDITACIITNQTKFIYCYAFFGCRDLQNINIPDSVISIGSGAFGGCIRLSEMSIPDSVISIGDQAFVFCSNLKIITIPDSVRSIGEGVFYQCSNYNYWEYIPLQYNEYDNVLCLGDSSNPYTVLIKAKTKDITSSTLNNQTKIICGQAFFGCRSLTSITIPDSVISIGDYAFYDCKSLTSITFNGTKAQWDAIDKGSNWEYNSAITQINCVADGETIYL